MPIWIPTRADALARLKDFLPRAGSHYAVGRNFDLGPDNRGNISGLSPYVRHRLIREDEIVAEVLACYDRDEVEMFLQEVCWRTYWKGWLELRPEVWNSYRTELASVLEALKRDHLLNERYQDAISGRSKIKCVDIWARELLEIGYLHNHARMWFASLWIFTLKLPWVLGADFFHRHLLDGDPASNTLSWRWVAGLQTKGKTYAATPGNIARFTEGRIFPVETFARECVAIEGPPLPAPGRLSPRDRPDMGPAALLITEDDVCAENLPLEGATPVAVASVLTPEDRSPLPISPLVRDFATGAVANGLHRAFLTFHVPREHLETWFDVVAWARRLGVRQVVTAEAPVGPVRDRLAILEGSLQQVGIRLVRIRRVWDDTLWPYASAGFFPFRKKLPQAITNLGLDRGRSA